LFDILVLTRIGLAPHDPKWLHPFILYKCRCFCLCTVSVDLTHLKLRLSTGSPWPLFPHNHQVGENWPTLVTLLLSQMCVLIRVTCWACEKLPKCTPTQFLSITYICSEAKSTKKRFWSWPLMTSSQIVVSKYIPS
jgi:hypothetical protein